MNKKEETLNNTGLQTEQSQNGSKKYSNKYEAYLDQMKRLTPQEQEVFLELLGQKGK